MGLEPSPGRIVAVGVIGSGAGVNVLVVTTEVLVGRLVWVALAVWSVVTTSWGASAPDSLLARLMAVVPAVLKPRLTRSLPATRLVTSNSSYDPPVTAPEVATVRPAAGALL
jgi:hypothetical protein